MRLSLKMAMYCFILWFCFAFFSKATVFAATRYVDCARPDDNGDGTSWATAKKSISSGIALLAGGDTLLVKEGTYTGSWNRIVGVPGGSAGAYTTIKANTDWGVTISNFVTEPGASLSNNYILLRGFKFKNGSGQKVMIGGDYVKVIRCATDGGGGSAPSFGCSGSYVLVEECYTYGEGRYPFCAYSGGDHTVFRRCVVRWDYSDTIEPQSCFNTYDQAYVAFQNCIAIDGKDIRARDVTYDGIKGFFTANGCSNVTIDGCIVLHFEGAGIYLEDSPVEQATIKNCVIWDLIDAGQKATEGYSAWPFYGRPGNGPVNITKSTFGVDDVGQGLRSNTLSDDHIKDSIIYGLTLNSGQYAVEGTWTEEDYNSFYNNTGGRNHYGGVGPHSKENINPLTNSLLYLVRIEDGSALDGLASDSGKIGASVVKRIGVSGTLWGETGWNTVTDEDLWPFPNEDEIRSDARAFYKAPGEAYPGSPEMNGDRGFCVDGQTLTKYIWEYLGNPIPSEIYGTGNVRIITSSLPNGTVGSFYSRTLEASGGTTPYAWSIILGSLPDGLTLDTHTGAISGTPSQEGLSKFTVQAADSASPANTATRDLSITIQREPVVNNPPTASVSAIPSSGTAPLTVNFSCSGTDTDGTIVSYEWNFADDTTSNQRDPSHTYDNPGTYTVILTLTDDDGATGTAEVTIIVTSTEAHIYYVRPPGGNYGKEDGSNYDDAWDGYSNINWGNLAANLPATLYVCGTHTMQLTVGAGGTGENARLTIRGDYPNDPALLDGGDSVPYGIYAEGHDYVTVDGFHIEDFETGIGFRQNADHGVVRNCRVNSCVVRGIYVATVNNIAIESNTCASSQTEHGIYLANNSDDCTIKGNTCYGNALTGIQLNGDGRLIERAIVDGNIIYNNGLSLDISCVHDSTIQNNLIYNSPTKGMVLWDSGYGSGYGCQDNKIINNTIHVSAAGNREGILVKGYSTGNAILNNVVCTGGCACVVVRTDSVAGTRIDHNHYYNNSAWEIEWEGTNYSLRDLQEQIGQDLHSNEGDPLFVNISGGDFHLQGGSPCINTGTSTLAPAHDLAGKPRPQGDGYDKGAYEYPGPFPKDTTPPVISNVAPSNVTDSSVTVTWTTDEGTTSQVLYGLTTSYGNQSPLSSDLTTFHSVGLTGLAANTTYHYRVISRDSSGNQAISEEYRFTTLPGRPGKPIHVE